VVTVRRRSRRLQPSRPLGRTGRALLTCGAIAVIAGAGLAAYTYVRLSRTIDARLTSGLERVQPRIFARPFVLRRGQALTTGELVERLNDLGYTQRPRVEHPGEFAVGATAVAILARGGEWDGQTIRAVFRRSAGRGARETGHLLNLEVVTRGRVDAVTVEPPLLTAVDSGSREKRRRVPLPQIPQVVREAVLAIEDRRFYDHPGVDVIRTIGAIVTNLRGNTPYLVGGSTITQQLVKNSFLTRDKTIRRKLVEQAMALMLERRLTKDDILELYLNEVYLGQRGSFAIHGVAEASRLYFGKDVTNLSVAEAATIAGLIQAPPVYSPFRNLERCRERRDVVLRAMAEAGYLSEEAAHRAASTPLRVVRRALEAEAPYFVDYVIQTLTDRVPGLASQPIDVYTTLDLHLQRIAERSVREGLAGVEKLLRGRRRAREVQAALLAVDPATGDVLAFVGGREYTQSQFNRVTAARRQPGSVFKPFVYLTAFEEAAATGRRELTPATIVDDTPTTFFYGDRTWSPRNYGDEYDGPISLRRALAMSRNVGTIKLAETVGFSRVADLWRRVGTSTPPRAVPSITLGVFEATPWEVAQAYTLFTNGGAIRPLRTIARMTSQTARPVRPEKAPPLRRIARPDTTFLVTSMMRSVLDEGTGAAARAAGFTLEAAGKSGTTNDLRDAWFVGFTPELLAVVWVGHDDNRALGLSGSQAALPIWTAFMRRALAGHPNQPFAPPAEGLSVVEIDPDTGKRPLASCPRVIAETFLAGTEPTELCDLHRYW
jgi:penicillin-binding protein 1B